MPPKIALEPTAAPLFPPSLRGHGGTGHSAVAPLRTRAACLPAEALALAGALHRACRRLWLSLCSLVRLPP